MVSSGIDNVVVKTFHPGMGQAVAERTILRKKEDGSWETWKDVADRVALGNSLLCKDKDEQKSEYEGLKKHIEKATIIMSGRHLQHGDETQPTRNMEVFTNCATSPTSFGLFLLLMNGSGVGRCYDDDIMLVNWDNSPNIRCVLDETHPDYDYLQHESARDAKHKYANGKDILWHDVEDTREGWAKALELWENATFEKIHKDKLLILNFSKIRCKGTPIKGMQNRPASGPVPLMTAFYKAATLKGAGLQPWKQAMFVDHYFAECVVVGGSRRSARMSVKNWRDSTVLDYITIKRPIEYNNLSIDEIKELNKSGTKPYSFLWSSNNSILVDKEFWRLVSLSKKDKEYTTNKLGIHARKVFKLATAASYGDGTGEPGFINVDKLVTNNQDVDTIKTGWFESKKYKPNDDTQVYLNRIINKCLKKQYFTITNPCSEIILYLWGAFCVIADLVPFHADTLEEFEDALRYAVRSLIRVNTMDSVYNKEVKRTNRIGIGLTGVHEFAWKFFKLGFKDLIDEQKSIEFWKTLSRFKKIVRQEADSYSDKLGMNRCHTDITEKPSGSVSKLFGLTEGWHLPAMPFYIRWVQFNESDPLVKKYEKNGYPVKQLKTYNQTKIVGFPTKLSITELGMGNKMVTMNDVSPEDQYKWLMLGEKYWIVGVDENGKSLKDTGNQISYTLKYNPKKIDYKQFTHLLKEYQSKIKCCSIMPQEDKSSYEYLPEQAVSAEEFQKIEDNIKKHIQEDVDFSHLSCENGACPVDFNKVKV